MRLNSYQLKCIAIITMLIDHIGAVLFPANLILRYIGRISFPIFCFLLAEGFYHTRNVKKYMLRLGIFAVLSEIPYDLAFRNTYIEFTRQNVFFTLLIGVVMMYAIVRTNNVAIKVTYLLLAMWAAQTVASDYGYKGILLIAVYHFLRENLPAKVLLGALWNFIWNASIQGYGALASLPIMLYNGKKGKSMKYIFYVFYPVHLLILYFVSVILIR